MSDPRVVKPKLPASTVVFAVAIAVGVMAFIVAAVWMSASGIETAKKTGVIVKKEFVPLKEEQIILDKKGNMTTAKRDGDYILTVEVTQPDGSKKDYNVWLDKRLYDQVKIGDKYDVGPALIRE